MEETAGTPIALRNQDRFQESLRTRGVERKQRLPQVGSRASSCHLVGSVLQRGADRHSYYSLSHMPEACALRERGDRDCQHSVV